MEKKIVYEDEALRYIAKFCDGGCRDAITLLDKCLSLSHDLTLENVLDVVGAEDYDTFFEFLNNLCMKGEKSISIIEQVYNAGKDIKQFMKDFSKFILEVEKYMIYEQDNGYINIPMTEDNKERLKYFQELRNEVFDVMDFVVPLNNQIKWDNDPKTLIELSILIYCGKEN